MALVVDHLLSCRTKAKTRLDPSPIRCKLYEDNLMADKWTICRVTRAKLYDDKL